MKFSKNAARTAAGAAGVAVLGALVAPIAAGVVYNDGVQDVLVWTNKA